MEIWWVIQEILMPLFLAILLLIRWFRSFCFSLTSYSLPFSPQFEFLDLAMKNKAFWAQNEVEYFSVYFLSRGCDTKKKYDLEGHVYLSLKLWCSHNDIVGDFSIFIVVWLSSVRRLLVLLCYQWRKITTIFLEIRMCL
jgi:hypothetical protein